MDWFMFGRRANSTDTNEGDKAGPTIIFPSDDLSDLHLLDPQTDTDSDDSQGNGGTAPHHNVLTSDVQPRRNSRALGRLQSRPPEVGGGLRAAMHYVKDCKVLA